MGAVQSVPVVGEVVTAVDSGVKLFSAGYWATVGELTGDDDAKEAGKKCLEDAGNTWVEYSERSLIAAPIRAAVHGIDGDGEEAKRVLKKMGKSTEQVIDSTPVVGHAKGVCHYIAGDTEHGNDCMKGATRSLAVVGVGAVTGGIGGGFVAGGLAGVTTGVAYDGVVTVAESAAKKEHCPYGIMSSIDRAIESERKGDLHGLWDSTVNVMYNVAGDFVTGGTAAQSAKELNKASKQRKAMREKIGKEPTKDVIDAAKHLEEIAKDVEGNNHVCTKAKNLETGSEAFGANKRLRKGMRVKKFKTKGKASGYTSKTNANKSYSGEFSGDVGLLEQAGIEMNMDIESQYPHRSLDACAEHQAIDRLGTHGAEANIRTTSVKWDNGNITALKRCDNCVQYGDLLGRVPTDAIDGMPVPTRQFVLDRSWPAVRDAALHAGVGIAICAFCGEAEECTCES